MKWNLASDNRKAAIAELQKQGKTLKEYPWPEDGVIVGVDPDSRLAIARCYVDGQTRDIVIEVK